MPKPEPRAFHPLTPFELGQLDQPESLTPFEKAVLALLWRIVRNTCPLLPDNCKDTGPPPEILLETFAPPTPCRPERKTPRPNAKLRGAD